MIKTRIGDIATGICFWPPPPAGPGPLPATGIVVSGNPMDLSGGLPTAGLGDIVLWPCGPGMITIGNPTNISMLPRSTLGAPVTGGISQGIISTGNPMDLSI